MSRLDRLRKGLSIILRGDQTKGDVVTRTHVGGSASGTDASDAWAYVPEGIRGQYYDSSSAENRHYWAKYHPWAYKATYGFSELLWQRTPKVKTSAGDDVEGGQVIDTIDYLESQQWRDQLIHLDTGAMVDGWSILLIYADNDRAYGGDPKHLASGFGWLEGTEKLAPLYRIPDAGKYGGIARLQSIWMRDLDMSPAENYDEEGWPKSYRYWYTEEEFVDIAADRCIHHRPKASMDYQGVSVLAPGWDALLWYIGSKDSIQWFIQKYGLTSMLIPESGAVTSTDRTAIRTAMKDWHKRGVIHYDSTAVTRPDFLSPPTMDFSSEHDDNANAFAASVGLPQLWLTGAAAGALASAEANERQLISKTRSEQEIRIPMLWRLLASHNPSTYEMEEILYFPVEQHVSERERATLDELLARAASAASQFLTVNEIRLKYFKVEEIAGGDETPMEKEKRQAEEMQTSTSFSFQGPNKGKSEEKGDTAEPEHKPSRNTKERLEYTFKRPWKRVIGDTLKLSARKACKVLKVSPNTLLSLRSQINES
jgi:hypothetical protein